ncbi:hypothetical protein [Emcibacter nanhaiensis]|uniref:N-acetyltransferase domain-containing protein n=1 Tax=Emcibacter nanhaiensis TaxID=1505037 RepID=A0A501PBJ7_9PROT|nr:hypothetical protein [Emcibacter nanhaiensis]TPD57417.1 hypothetical protein FIV46_14940 [Emcibacter nanhaiensis]
MKKKLKKIIRYLVSRLYAHEILYLYRHKVPRDIHSEARIELATPENLGTLKAFQTDDQIAKFQEFLEAGDIGYLAFLGDQCVHRSWVVVRKGDIKLHWSLSHALAEGEAYIHYCETAPAARGKKVYPAVLCRICSDLNRDFNIFINVNKKNLASISGIERAGFEKVVENRILIVMGLKFHKAILFENEV